MLVRSIGLSAKCFSSGQQFLDSLDDDGPCCIVLDLAMPGMSGKDVQNALNLKTVRYPVIFVTGHADVAFTAQAIRDGAMDVMCKPVVPKTFLARIRSAIEADLVSRQQREELATIRIHVSRLTRREREIAGLLITGQSPKQIAHTLGISPKTVENHRAAVLEKMEVDNPTQLACQLLQLNDNRIFIAAR